MRSWSIKMLFILKQCVNLKKVNPNIEWPKGFWQVDFLVSWPFLLVSCKVFCHFTYFCWFSKTLKLSNNKKQTWVCFLKTFKFKCSVKTRFFESSTRGSGSPIPRSDASTPSIYSTGPLRTIKIKIRGYLGSLLFIDASLNETWLKNNHWY